MAALAGGSGLQSALKIDGPADRFKVLGVHAVANPAEVVEVEPVGDRPVAG